MSLRRRNPRADLLRRLNRGEAMPDGTPSSWTDSLRYLLEATMPEHKVDSLVCCPGHRYPLRVVGTGPLRDYKGRVVFEGGQAYHLADERAGVQPYPGVHVRAADVKPYNWRSLLELSAPHAHCTTNSDWLLDVERGDYLDACAYLHDLAHALPAGSAAQKAAHDTADELLNEAAQRWRERCEACGGSGLRSGTATAKQWESVTAPLDGVQDLYVKHRGDTVTWWGGCTACDGTSRITDDHRLRLVEALIAAGLPERWPLQRAAEVDAIGIERDLNGLPVPRVVQTVTVDR